MLIRAVLLVSKHSMQVGRWWKVGGLPSACGCVMAYAKTKWDVQLVGSSSTFASRLQNNNHTRCCLIISLAFPLASFTNTAAPFCLTSSPPFHLQNNPRWRIYTRPPLQHSPARNGRQVGVQEKARRPGRRTTEERKDHGCKCEFGVFGRLMGPTAPAGGAVYL
jgi:hypothetical protein